MTVILPMLISCAETAEQRYVGLRDACDMSEDEFVPLPFGADGSVLTITESCARASGDALHIEWEQFSSEPAEFVLPSARSDYLLGGLMVVIGADLGSVAALREYVPEGATVDLMLDEFEESEQADSSFPAGVFWLWWIERAISSSVPGESETGLLGFDDGTLFVYLVPDGEDALSRPEHPVTIASALAHELGHSVPNSEHIVCPGGERRCDSDGTGAYGTGLAFLTAWWYENAAIVSTEDCLMAEETAFVYCIYVDDWAGTAACEDRAEFQCGE